MSIRRATRNRSTASRRKSSGRITRAELRADTKPLRDEEEARQHPIPAAAPAHRSVLPWLTLGLSGLALPVGWGTYNVGRGLGRIGNLTAQDLDWFLREYPRPSLSPNVNWAAMLSDLLLKGRVPHPKDFLVPDPTWPAFMKSLLEGQPGRLPAKDYLISYKPEGLLRESVVDLPSFFTIARQAVSSEDFLKNYLQYIILGSHLTSKRAPNGMTMNDWVRWLRQPHALWIMQPFFGDRTRYWGEDGGYYVNGKIHRAPVGPITGGGSPRDHYTSFYESPHRAHEQMSAELHDMAISNTLPRLMSIWNEYYAQLQNTPGAANLSPEARKAMFVNLFSNRLSKALLEGNHFSNTLMQLANKLPKPLRYIPYVMRDTLLEIPAKEMTSRTAEKLYDAIQKQFPNPADRTELGEVQPDLNKLLEALGVPKAMLAGEAAGPQLNVVGVPVETLQLSPERLKNLRLASLPVDRIRAVMQKYDDLLNKDPLAAIEKIHQELKDEPLPELHALALAMEKYIQPSFSLPQYSLLTYIPQTITRSVRGAYQAGNLLRTLGLLSMLGGGTGLGWLLYRYLRNRSDSSQNPEDQSATTKDQQLEDLIVRNRILNNHDRTIK